MTYAEAERLNPLCRNCKEDYKSHEHTAPRLFINCVICRKFKDPWWKSWKGIPVEKMFYPMDNLDLIEYEAKKQGLI